MALDTSNTNINYLFGRLFAVLQRWEKTLKQCDDSSLTESKRGDYVGGPTEAFMNLNIELSSLSIKSKVKCTYFSTIVSEIIETMEEGDFEKNAPLTPLYMVGEMDQKNAFGNPGYMMKVIREEYNYSQRELADKIGKTQGEISRWETGEVSPRSEVLEKIAKAFGVTVPELNGGRFND